MSVKQIQPNEKYTKPIGVPLKMYECIQLLEKLVENDMIQQDPQRTDNLIIYFSESDTQPEGWYSQNIYEVAEDLMRDFEGQKFLMKELAEKNIKMEFTNILSSPIERSWDNNKSKKDIERSAD